VTAMDPAELLPHRWPMLLLDEVVAVEPGVRLVARRSVSAGDPWCGPTGFAPYLVLESWLQACAALLRLGSDGAADVLVVGLRGIRATRALRPGETVEHRVSVVRGFDTSAIFSGVSVVGDETVLTAEQATIATT
jgi:3-hydroxyacyl-[acyl-carrier-protein] dehydratase